VLLILYAGSQTTSTLFMSTTMEKTQRYLLLAMPLVFLFFVVNFPAGLMIYWVTTNLWTTGQGLVTRTLRPAPKPVQKRSSRTPARDSDGGAQPKGETPKPAATGQPARRVKRKKRARR
jgi:YidC/Oxa1 family membrane protein insertase